MAGTIDVEHDGEFLRHVMEDTGYPHISAFIKRAFDSVIPQKAIDFRTNVCRVIQDCLYHHGTPQFRTKYAGEPLGAGLPDGAFALMICFGSHNGKFRGVWFKKIPQEDLEILRSRDGYPAMLRKYGSSYHTGSEVKAPSKLEYFMDGQPVTIESFKREWAREFPSSPIPTAPAYRTGRYHIFTVTVEFKSLPGREETALEASLRVIEETLQEALKDEEKAAPFYETLKNGIEGTRSLVPTEDFDIDSTLFAASKNVERIMFDEKTHKQKIANMILDVQDARKKFQVRKLARLAQKVLV